MSDRHASTARPPYRALAVTASNRASRGVYEDTGGPLLVEGLAAMGFAADGPRVVPDGPPVAEALRAAVAEGYDVVLTTGGTGVSPTDRTPEMTRGVLDYEVPGIAEAIRAEGLAKVPTAALSRGIAGVADRTLIVNLPGSSGGVRDGLAVLARLLVHAVDQIHGGDHVRRPDEAAHGQGPAAHGHAPAHGLRHGHGHGPDQGRASGSAAGVPAPGEDGPGRSDGARGTSHGAPGHSAGDPN